MAEPAPTKRVKMYHFTCSKCREKKVNTLFCTLMDPDVARSCICPQFVDLENCVGPGGEGLVHISYDLDNVNVAVEDECLQFIVSIGRGPGTEGQLAYVHKVFCATCEILIGYQYIGMVTGNGQMKFSIVENTLQKDDINSEAPSPIYLLSQRLVTRFLTKRK